MSDNTLTVCEYRVEDHLARLWDAVNTTDPVRVLSTAADTLDAVYALTRLWRGTLLSKPRYDAACREEEGGRIVAGLTHLRGRAVHHAVVLSDFTDRVAQYYYDHYGCWVWRSVTSSSDELAAMYSQHVAGQEVRVTIEPVRQFLLSDLPTRLRPISTTR